MEQKLSIYYFRASDTVYAVQTTGPIASEDLKKLLWLFETSAVVNSYDADQTFIGPRKESITPWSTNAVEITQNMRIPGIVRIEKFSFADEKPSYDPMLQAVYKGLKEDAFTIHKEPAPILLIEDIVAYNEAEGLALSEDEIAYLDGIAKRRGKPLTDCEVFGFAQANSEHCRHKIFNGTFIIDGERMPSTLFELIKSTTKNNKNRVVSAYTDNCAFLEGPVIQHYAPANPGAASDFALLPMETVLSLKAETHNFPTTVEPFSGAATGTGGEIRDRMGGGKGSFPLAGTAVYMTPYARLYEHGERPFENRFSERDWLYQTPNKLLIRASDGASDFGNKFGQPLINGSLLTFEHSEAVKVGNEKVSYHIGYDKVIMMAGGVGFANKRDLEKEVPPLGAKIVLFGGDNYLIGLGGGSVSSVEGGVYGKKIDLNAVQRPNPEMQKRVYDALRAVCERSENPIYLIHDHGAGGHVNCFSELMEHTGGKIYIEKLPLGDPTLSTKEILGNESQERMGVVVPESFIEELDAIAKRERVPLYVVGDITDDHRLHYLNRQTGEEAISFTAQDLFGNTPVTVLEDEAFQRKYTEIAYDPYRLEHYLKDVLGLEAVACKDWLTNKVDRSVTGRVATQQTCGPLQLPLNNVGVVALDYVGKRGVATAIGHAPVAGLIDPGAGSVLSIAEALTNIVWAPIEGGLSGVSLSANWMWPAKNPGENARLYAAVKAAADFANALGINIPTGKDSLSMKQRYHDKEVVAPGTVIISATGEVTDITKTLEPVLKTVQQSKLYYIRFGDPGFALGGSSLGQAMGKIGRKAPMVSDAEHFKNAFSAVQELVERELLLAGHDVSAGGLITCLLEMSFSTPMEMSSVSVDLSAFDEDIMSVCFSESPGVVVQTDKPKEFKQVMRKHSVDFTLLGTADCCEDSYGDNLSIRKDDFDRAIDIEINDARDMWYTTSYLLDKLQSGEDCANQRLWNNSDFPIEQILPKGFKGSYEAHGLDPLRTEPSGIKAAIIREKGVNGDREAAWSMTLAGFDVKDVHMTDLIEGRESLEDVNFLFFVGGFSNSDVLGSAKGWAGAFKYNDKAKRALERFYAREDTMSIGVCNGCQLMMELDLLGLGERNPKMGANDSGKFESAFLEVHVRPENPSIMLRSLEESQLGIWVAHGQGKFIFPSGGASKNIVLEYAVNQYPMNPNGSQFSAAGICSEDGRHLAMMPHLERAIHPWQHAHYPDERKKEDLTPWIEAFINARKWIEEEVKK